MEWVGSRTDYWIEKIGHKNTIQGKDVAQLVKHLHHHAQGHEFNAQDTSKLGTLAQTYHPSSLKMKRKMRDWKSSRQTLSQTNKQKTLFSTKEERKSCSLWENAGYHHVMQNRPESDKFTRRLLEEKMAPWNLPFYNSAQHILTTWDLNSVTENDDHIYRGVLDNYKIG